MQDKLLKCSFANTFLSFIPFFCIAEPFFHVFPFSIWCVFFACLCRPSPQNNNNNNNNTTPAHTRGEGVPTFLSTFPPSILGIIDSFSHVPFQSEMFFLKLC